MKTAMLLAMIVLSTLIYTQPSHASYGQYGYSSNEIEQITQAVRDAHDRRDNHHNYNKYKHHNTTPVTSIPLPGAVYLMGGALLLLFVLKRKKVHI